jgi:hypothetical protein
MRVTHSMEMEAKMADDIILKILGIDDKSKTSGHLKEIDIQSFS